ncbi:branched-chain amino acid ABC transporter permease [Tuberibacillus sp. Marseille-P3662]|uniref:branched-chain amino acid ABC transporter permease n=1 Tax=Tuberibacillus sp. Marseille-P3662 TaxID=1965358 RepID=UPI000A1CDBBB|nr:branched-chain amino acid ABC transporter permease [Tuberibacillus sp. Marseille-P3662]
MIRKQWLFVVLLVIGGVLPFIVPNQYYLYVTALGFIWAIAVYGLNLITGYTGQLNLGHAGFFAIGAYTVGILTKAGMSFWMALGLGCLLTMVVGLLVGIISLRLREHYFAIFTLCVGFIIYLIIQQWDSLTGGVVGLIGVPYPEAIGPIIFENHPINMYYLILFFLLCTVFFFSRIVHSIIGRTFTAIKNSEALAQTLGISLIRNKIVAFVLSTFFAGLAGGLYAVYIRFLGAEIGHVTITFDILMYLLVGGIGTISGPIVGTLLVTWVTQYLNAWSEYRMIIFGPLLILLVIFSPKGIVGSLKGWMDNRKAKRLKATTKDSQSNIKEAG